MIYLKMVRYEKALVDLNQVIKLNAASWSLYNQTLVNQILRKKGEAEDEINDAVKLAHRSYRNNPQDGRNAVNLATY